MHANLPWIISQTPQATQRLTKESRVRFVIPKVRLSENEIGFEIPKVRLSENKIAFDIPKVR